MSKREIIETAAQLGRMGFSAYAIQKLMRIERTLHHLGERSCNGDGWGPGRFENGRYIGPNWNDADELRVEKRENSLMVKAQELCNDANTPCTAYHQGDPRGCALYIVPDAEFKGLLIDSVYNRGVAV